MKTIIKIIAITFSVMVFYYLVISMVELSFNFADWREKAIIILTFIGFGTLFSNIFINSMIEEN